MAYTTLPLDRLWRRLACHESFAAFSLVKDTVEELDAQPFAAAFTTAVERATSEGVLTSEVRQALLEFADGCGNTDLEGQQAHIAYYRRLLQQLWERADDVWREKGRLYRVLGSASGVALALLLL